MKNEEKLYLAIGEIDDGIIAEASETVVKKSAVAVKIIAIAASAFIVTIGVLLSAGGLLGQKNMDSAPSADGSWENKAESPGMPMPGEDEVSDREFISDIGRLTLLGNEGNSYSFILEITVPTNKPIHVHTLDKSHNYNSSTDPAKGTALSPTILVNGKAADYLPGEIGRYEIEILFPDFNDMDNESAPGDSDNQDGVIPPGSPPLSPDKDQYFAPENMLSYFIIDNFGPVPFSIED